MSERIERYARGLEGLSLQELSEGAETLVSFQRRNEAALIAHLAEISRRKGHLELGYRSLFDYCTGHLGLGKYSVWNRTQVAGVSRRFPQVLGALAEGKVSLSSLGVLAPHLSEENVDRLLAEAEGKTKDEVKEVIAAIHPKPAAEPMIRRRPAPRTPTGNVEPARPDVYNFRFSAGRGLREKLERLGEVLGIENSTGRMPEIIEKALDLALEKKDPKRKLERRRKREEARARARPDEATAASHERSSPSRRTGSAGVSRASSPKGASATREGRARSRYVPSPVRERVLERAAYRCEYTGPFGVRCRARAGLEIDHIKPWGKGGSSGEENLRALCRAHNVFRAAREYGEAFMKGRIGAGVGHGGSRVAASGPTVSNRS